MVAERFSIAQVTPYPWEQHHEVNRFVERLSDELCKRGHRIVEVPIPTYYGDEICHVNGLPYAANCVREMLGYAVRYRLPFRSLVGVQERIS